MSEINLLLQKVCDKESFLIFLDHLRLDKIQSSDKWENLSIEDFLEAAYAWAQDSDNKVSESNLWQYFAKLLYAGRSYE
jgi:hypothetical protein